MVADPTVAPEPYYDLGSFHRAVDTDSSDAQLWFDRGLVWAYAFNHEEAIALLRARTGARPRAGHRAVGHRLRDRAQLQQGLGGVRPGRSRGLAGAGARRTRRGECGPRHRRRAGSDRGTAGAVPVRCRGARCGRAGRMRTRWPRSRGSIPDDLDVLTLAADALLNLTAWALWDTATGEPAPGSRVVDAVALLDAVLATRRVRTIQARCTCTCTRWRCRRIPRRRCPRPTACAAWCPTPVTCCTCPATSTCSAATTSHRSREPGGGARPTASSSTARAVELLLALPRPRSALRRVLGDVPGPLRDRARGRRRTRRPADARTAAHREPADGGLAGGVRAAAHHVLVRFGRWDELSRSRCPPTPTLYCTTAATIHYGRGVALRGDRAARRRRMREREQFAAAYARIPESRYLFNNTSRDILAVAAAMLDGEIAYREGRFDEAFAALRHAIELDDALPYDEPWGWMQPTRHALRRAAARAGPGRGGRRGVRRRPRPRRRR